MTFAALVSVAVLAAEPATADVYALVIGYNGGREGLPALRFADDDALRMARAFSALPNHRETFVVADADETTRETLQAAGLAVPPLRPPTRAGLFAARDALKQKLAARPAGRRATVYLFYAGHGIDGELLLKPEADGAPSGMTGLELKGLAAALPADDVVLFVDACRAQSLFTSRGATGPDLTARIDALNAQANAARFGVLAAAQSNQPAGETDRLQGGFFSHVLASGLVGGADVDGDDVVRFGELAAFVAFHTERLTGQRPWFEPPGGELQSPTVQLFGATRLTLTANTAGRVQVSTVNGVPFFAEVNKAKGRTLKLALPAGRYKVAQSGGGSAEVELTAGSNESFAGEAIADRGGEDDGFGAPFTPSVVAALDAGFVSGRQPSVEGQAWRHAFDLAYEVSPAPFGLSGVEHGVEAGYRFSFGRLLVGPKVSFRTSSGENGVQLRRIGVLLQAAWKFEPLSWLEVSPWGGVGFKSLLIEGPAPAFTPFSPGFGAGLRISALAGKGISFFVDARYEAASVVFKGSGRQLWGEPAVLFGVTLWL